MSAEAGAKEQVQEDRLERTGGAARWTALAAGLLMLALAVRPGVVIEKISAVGAGWVDAIALQRCLALHEPKGVAVGLPDRRPEVCESALGGLRAAMTGREEVAE